MRILVAVHGLPPDSLGGTEIYADGLARALQRQGEDVLLLAAEATSERAEMSVREEDRDGVRAIRVNNTFSACQSFEDTYRHPEMRRICAEVLQSFGPDVVHVQHLTRLTTDLVEDASALRIPVVFTLQDYWLLCHRGQLVDADYRVCRGPSPSACARCLGLAGSAGPRLHRLAPMFRRIERHAPRALTAALRVAATRAGWMTAGRDTGVREAEKRQAHVRHLCRLVTRFLAPSEALAGRFRDFGVEADRITPWNPGIAQIGRTAKTASGAVSVGLLEHAGDTVHGDHGSRNGARALACPPAPLRIGFLGSLMITKAPDVLLRASTLLPPGRVVIRLFGEPCAYHGDDRYTQVLAPLLALPSVERHGGVKPEHVAAALAELDVLVVPSTWPENSPFVIREAFAAGVPVVASRIGGIPEIVQHEVNGLLFEPGDEHGLAHELQRLLDDPSLLDRLRSGIPPVRSIDEDAAETVALYRSLLSRRSCQAGPEPNAQNLEPSRRLAAVVLNHRTPDVTRMTVQSLRASDRPLDDIIVVDTSRAADERGALPEGFAADVTVIRTRANLGYSGGNNVGIRLALERGADRVLLVNSDVIVPPEVISRLERAADEHPHCGIAGPVILSLYDPERVVFAGIGFSLLTGRMRHHYFRQPFAHLDEWVAREAGRARRGNGVDGRGNSKTTYPVDVISGCVMLVERAVFEAIGLLDERYFYSFEDLDFCLQARKAGFASVLAGDACVYHEGGRSIGARSPRRLYFAARNHLLLARRLAPDGSAAATWTRAAAIVGMHVVHALLFAEARRVDGLRHVARGVADHLRGRYGNPWGD